MFDTLKNISRYIGTIFNDNCAETFNCLIGKETKELDTMHTIWLISGIFPGGGGGGGGRGHSGTEGGRTRITYFAEEGVFIKTSACQRFCKSRVLSKNKK